MRFMAGIVVAIPISTEGKISKETKSKLTSAVCTVYEEKKIQKFNYE